MYITLQKRHFLTSLRLMYMFWTPAFQQRHARAQSRPFAERDPPTMYYVRALSKLATQRTHLARRRRYNRYLMPRMPWSLSIWLEMFAVVAASISKKVCWLRASTSSTSWARRTRRGLRSGRRSFTRHDAAGGQRLHPQPADGTPAFHRHGGHHPHLPGNRR